MSSVLLELSATEIKAYYYLHLIEQILPDYNSLRVGFTPSSKSINIIRDKSPIQEELKI